MRDILFRGKRIDNGEWVVGCYCRGATRHCISTGLPECLHYDVIPETVGQSTSLLDAKYNRIFEGDILKVKTFWEHAKGAVIEKKERVPWNSEIGDDVVIDKIPREKGDTYWSVEYKDYTTQSGYFAFGIDRRWSRPLTNSRIYNSEAEVVGNIYDNPELLEIKNE